MTAEGWRRRRNICGRTPSAISLQMKRLQEDLGIAIFRKRGRGLALTEAGEVALSLRAPRARVER